MCWHVQNEPPRPTEPKELDVKKGSIMDVIEPSLFWYRDYQNLAPNAISNSKLKLYATAFIYPDPPEDECELGLAYCPDKFAVSNGNINYQQYPLKKRWLYLINLADLETGQEILNLPELKKSIYLHEIKEGSFTNTQFGFDIQDWYMAWTDTADPLIILHKDLRCQWSKEN